MVQVEKLAIATDGGMVAAHFGRCPAYTLVELSGGRIQAETILDNPGHEPGVLPGYLADRGVTCMLAGGMGPRAEQLFHQRGVRTITGISGPVSEAVQSYISNTLNPGDSTCEHRPGP